MFGITEFLCNVLPSNNSSILSVSEDTELQSFVLLMLGVVCVFGLLFLLYKLILKINTRNVSGNNIASNDTDVTENVVDKDTVNDAELIAAITAAIAMAESEDSGLKFRVVAFKRI